MELLTTTPNFESGQSCGKENRIEDPVGLNDEGAYNDESVGDVEPVEGG